MAVPKRRTSASKRDKRRAHDSLQAPHVIACPQCGGRIVRQENGARRLYLCRRCQA